MPLRHIYVVRLKRNVLKNRRFLKRNPDCDLRKRPLYVGLTSKDPAERLAQHKAGKRASSFVKKYGKNLWPEKGERTYRRYAAALRKEKRVADKLRQQGFPVWQN